MKDKHTLYYIFETILLGIGFFIVYLNGNVYIQGVLLLVLLMVYVMVGVVHHRLTHDITVKIMLEYVLISALVFSVFLLFKSGAI